MWCKNALEQAPVVGTDQDLPALVVGELGQVRRPAQ